MWKLLIALIIGICLFITPVKADELKVNSLTETQIQQGEEIFRLAITATEKGDFTTAEKYWDDLIEQFPTNPALWSNRGNAKVSQYKLAEAINDYNQSIELAPNAPDPYLNRGVAYEGLGEYQQAIADYKKVLELNPEDVMAYNNIGNAYAGLQDWAKANEYYHQASQIAPDFALARANESLVLYELGKKDQALTQIKNLVRKYPMFPDMRAALTAILWEKGDQGEAESNWVATVGIDRRYQDVQWLKEVRRWPPSMIMALEKFLNLENNHSS